MSSSTVYRLSGMSLLIGGLLAAIGTVGQAFFPNLVDIVTLPWLTKINAFNTIPLSFILFFLLAKLFLLVGSVSFGIAMLRTGIFPKGSVILLIVGAILFLFGGRIHIIPYLDYLGEVLFLMSFVWFGSSLLSQPQQENELQPVAVPGGTEARV